MSEMDFFKMAWHYATGTLPADKVDTLWVRVLERSERLDLLLTIGGITITHKKSFNWKVGS